MHTFVVLAYKESKYLKDCIESTMNQTYPSKVVIATSTRNPFIDQMAKSYQLEVIENPDPGMGIGYDFDFAVSCGQSKLVTVAHQDDIYDNTYAQKMVEGYEKEKDSTIIFSDYYEIRDNNKVYNNTNLKIKRILLLPLRIRFLAKRKFGRRLSLRFGNAICCPAVTFVKENIQTNDIFKCNLKCNVDWHAWEKISRINGAFLFINEKLMGHRVHDESTTTEIINDNIRTKEDLVLFKRFWPNFVAKALNKFYIKAEESNK
ncbi:MAG: glycosyltransferase family A protein [Coprobacillaceae bacterium]